MTTVRTPLKSMPLKFDEQGDVVEVNGGKVCLQLNRSALCVRDQRGRSSDCVPSQPVAGLRSAKLAVGRDLGCAPPTQGCRMRALPIQDLHMRCSHESH